MTPEEAFDYIIVGAGSAGCVLANRLSEDPGTTVALLEFGGTDMGPFIQMPAALSYPLNMRRYDWGYRTEPEPHLGGRQITCPRGKLIGGSSSINGMVYVRGHPLDFDRWAELGAHGWSAADVLPYFKRLETAHEGDPSARGISGPMHVIQGRMKNPLYQAFINAGREAGYPTTNDYNAQQQEGFGPMEQTIWQGRRWSAANAYLKPVRRRPNLFVIKHTLAERVVFDGKRAVGVDVRRRGGIETFHARREIVLSASSINSPKILMLSGIGDAGRLSELGIDVVSDLAGVGENLQDHLELYLQMQCTQPVTLNRHLNWMAKGLIGLRWLTTRTGIGASNHFEAAGFIRSKAGIPYPDIQFHFLPAAIRYDGSAAARGDGFQVHVGPMRSESRGWVRLRSNEPTDRPQIQFNYMSQEEDWKDFRAALRLTRELFSQPAFRPYAGEEIMPGDQCHLDDDLDAFIREEVESAYHPCGTCRMGDPDDESAVVDPQCRVIGVDGLRVVDSSVFPHITNGNINAPTLMLAEKASDHIKGVKPLAPETWDYWQHPDWQTSQR